MATGAGQVNYMAPSIPDEICLIVSPTTIVPQREHVEHSEFLRQVEGRCVLKVYSGSWDSLLYCASRECKVSSFTSSTSGQRPEIANFSIEDFVVPCDQLRVRNPFRDLVIDQSYRLRFEFELVGSRKLGEWPPVYPSDESCDFLDAIFWVDIKIESHRVTKLHKANFEGFLNEFIILVETYILSNFSSPFPSKSSIPSGSTPISAAQSPLPRKRPLSSILIQTEKSPVELNLAREKCVLEFHPIVGNMEPRCFPKLCCPTCPGTGLRVFKTVSELETHFKTHQHEIILEVVDGLVLAFETPKKRFKSPLLPKSNKSLEAISSTAPVVFAATEEVEFKDQHMLPLRRKPSNPSFPILRAPGQGISQDVETADKKIDIQKKPDIQEETDIKKDPDIQKESDIQKEPDKKDETVLETFFPFIEIEGSIETPWWTEEEAKPRNTTVGKLSGTVLAPDTRRRLFYTQSWTTISPGEIVLESDPMRDLNVDWILRKDLDIALQDVLDTPTREHIEKWVRHCHRRGSQGYVYLSDHWLTFLQEHAEWMSCKAERITAAGKDLAMFVASGLINEETLDQSGRLLIQNLKKIPCSKQEEPRYECSVTSEVNRNICITCRKSVRKGTSVQCAQQVRRYYIWIENSIFAKALWFLGMRA